MATQAATPNLASNIGPIERWVSILGGLALVGAALRRGHPGRSAGLGLAGTALPARGGTRFCPMKAAATGQASLQAGFKEEMRRMLKPIRGGTADIRTMRDLYIAELQELHSAEEQLMALLPEIARTMHDPALKPILSGYAGELDQRRQEIERILNHYGADPQRHPDQAMRALLAEAHKMMMLDAAPHVVDAALISSVQRLLHYRIAGYGSVAAYAKGLGEIYEAGALSGAADRDKSFDTELSSLAERAVNPAAIAESAER